MLKIFPDLKNSSLLFVGVLLVCFAVSVGKRYQQFETWKKTPAIFFVGERPMMTTLDAPYWLRWAREYNEGIFGEKDGLRNYPEGTEIFHEKFVKELSIPQKYTDQTSHTNNSLLLDENRVISYRDVPLLSFLIAQISPYLNYNYYLTGTLLIPVLASLFILPLGIYFFSIGVPVSGLLGGLVGTFASGYYMRSSIGRIDTDMLNLFFPVISSLLILLASLAKSERAVLLYSFGTGLCLFLFQWWYNRPGFTLAYFIILVLSLFVQKVRFRTLLLSAFLFVLCCHPGNFLSGKVSVENFLKNYFLIDETVSSNVIQKGPNPASFPNVLKTISEAGTVQFNEVFRRIFSNHIIAWTGFLAFFALALFRLRDLLPLTPILALGLLSFQSSNRFIMYLAPFIGIGLGWLLQFGIDAVFQLIVKKSQHIEEDGDRRESRKTGFPFWEIREFGWFGWFRQGILYLGMGVFFWGISSHTAISFVPGPSIHTGIYATFLEVKKRVQKDAALLTWWDYGFAITDATKLATFHDGSAQFSPKTYFIARSLISSDQNELYDITQYLATEANLGIEKNNTSPEALIKAVRNPEHKPWNPIYLFFTADMTGKYGAISKLGSWDVEKGGSKPKAYQNLACSKITKQELNCHGALINLNDGFINNKLALRRLIFIRKGQVIREKIFSHSQGFTLQLIVAGKNIVEVQLIDESVFRSNYNQMFLLGRYSEELFEERYNASPLSRLFKFKF